MAKLTFKQWIKNIWDAAVTGGCNSVLAATGLAGAHSLGVDVELLDYKQMGAIFLSGMTWEVIRYIKNNPSPDLEDTNEEKPKS